MDGIELKVSAANFLGIISKLFSQLEILFNLEMSSLFLGLSNRGSI